MSSVINYQDNDNTGVILTLTNGSDQALVRYRDFDGAAWLTSLQTVAPLRKPYTGATVDIAIISDPHFSVGGFDPAARLTEAIDDIDDNAGTCSYVFVLGDICNDVNDYASYLAVRATSDIAAANWHELPGNHDFAVLANFQAALGYTPPYHKLELGNVSFLFLAPDADSRTLSAAQQAWLASEMATNDNIVILSHQGREDTTRSTNQVNGHMEPNFTIGSRVALWFCGHSHGYAGEGTPDATNIDTGCVA